MPITRSAKKKMRQDKKRENINLVSRNALKKIIKDYKKNPSEKLLSKVYSLLDSSSKKKLLHKNKVSRLKERLSVFLAVKKEKIKKPNKS